MFWPCGQPFDMRRSNSKMNFSITGICPGKTRALNQTLPSGFRPAPALFPPCCFFVFFMDAILAVVNLDFNTIFKLHNMVFAGSTHTLYTPIKSTVFKLRGVFVQKAQSYAKQSRTLISTPRAKSDLETPLSAYLPPIKTRHNSFYAQYFCAKPLESSKTA